jgi:hypothetical protein
VTESFGNGEAEPCLQNSDPRITYDISSVLISLKDVKYDTLNKGA